MTSPFRTTAQLGPNLWQVVTPTGIWYDGGKQIPSPQLGVVEFGDDGREYIWVKASAAIAAAAEPGTQVAITTPAFTAAAGSGGWYAPNSTELPGGVPINSYFWAAKGTAP